MAGQTSIHPFNAVGIDVGSVSVKVCGLADGAARAAVVVHEGDIESALDTAFAELALDRQAAPPAVVTGGAGRHRLDVAGVIASSAIEAALDALGLRPRAVVSLGGEDLVVYLLDGQGRVQTTSPATSARPARASSSASSSGAWTSASRISTRPAGARALKLSARCSVFMKSDCTHRLNKGEATRGDMALSLSKVMADKVSEFLIRAKIRNGAVVLIGGVTQNRHFLRFLEEAWPQTWFAVPDGGAVSSRRSAPRTWRGRWAGRCHGLVGAPVPAGCRHAFASLASAESRVTYHASRRGPLRPDASTCSASTAASTTTKVALVDAETLEIVAAHYGRTHGDPVAALKRCLRGGAGPDRRRPAPHQPDAPPPARRASCSACSWRRPASTTRSSPTRWAPPTSSPRSTPSSRSAGRTPSTSC